MEIEKAKAIIEAILFAAGRKVSKSEIAICLEVEPEDVIPIIENMKIEYEEKNRGIEIIKIEDGYQLCSKKEYYEYIYQVLDKRSKPNLSSASLETLAIIAYNPKVTRAEIESIRGVSSDASIYKLLEYGLIEEAGRLDAPGRPNTYKVSQEFFKMFGYSSLEELPDLPRYKLDENEQIVLEEFAEEKKEAPDPEREEEIEEPVVELAQEIEMANQGKEERKENEK